LAFSLYQNPEPRTTFAFYRVSHVFAKQEKPFKDGNIEKETFLEAAVSFFEHFKNRAQIVKAINEEELSHNTCRRKNGYVCGGPTQEVIEACECLSSHFDESTDM